MRVSVGVGCYAKKPYRIPGLEIDVYSMEELCYCIRENAFLLDASFLSGALLGWIEEECGLRELAKSLHPLVHKKGTLSAFAGAILSYVGFYDQETVQETAQVLKQGAGLDAIERRKRQIDYMVKNKRYKSAVKGYEALLDSWKEQESRGNAMPAVGCLARIWHNKGVAFAGLMLYDRAAECFRKAYELEQREDYCMDYLAARRMLLSEEEYVAFAAEHKELYQYSLKLEKKMEQYIQEWEQQPDYLRLYNRRELRGGGDIQKYCEDSERLTQVLKDSYRNCQRSSD